MLKKENKSKVEQNIKLTKDIIHWRWLLNKYIIYEFLISFLFCTHYYYFFFSLNIYFIFTSLTQISPHLRHISYIHIFPFKKLDLYQKKKEKMSVRHKIDLYVLKLLQFRAFFLSYTTFLVGHYLSDRTFFLNPLLLEIFALLGKNTTHVFDVGFLIWDNKQSLKFRVE